ncbi:MAG: hypothetical protein ABFE07_28605 [Armatimonadia bacterium]
MNYFRPRERVRAEQWLPGKPVEGVCDSTPDEQGKQTFCGCLALGGPGVPHVHTHPEGGTYHSALHSVLINPGDWVVYLDSGERRVMTDEEFQNTYEAVENWEI